MMSPLSYNGLENIRSSFLPVCVSTRVARTAAAQYLAVILVAAGWDRFNGRRSSSARPLRAGQAAGRDSLH
jgi:hypothetical protein